MTFNINKLVRAHIKSIIPYSSARDEFSGNADIFLDANENSLGPLSSNCYNRYPDPHQVALKEQISKIKQIPVENIFLGNGSDECIDLLYRCFCEPAIDTVIICPPTYGMYEVSATINNVKIRKVPLTDNFQIDIKSVWDQIDSYTKIIWLCSPNNPSGNDLNFEEIETLLNSFEGIVVVDEAYIDFSGQKTFTSILSKYPNLVVLQTLSKAYGLAGLRLGMAFSSREIVHYLNCIKPPYNISHPSQELALQSLKNINSVNFSINEIIRMRNELSIDLKRLKIVQIVFPSNANFLLVKMVNAHAVYQYLLSNAIVVRDRSKVQFCEDCLRITVGTKNENTKLMDALINYEKNFF